MPLLRDQGDGVKNFVGLILNIVAAPFFYLLIDEPDLYLHPPQADLIGRLIGSLKRPETQVFLATHSADLLKGLISPPRSGGQKFPFCGICHSTSRGLGRRPLLALEIDSEQAPGCPRRFERALGDQWNVDLLIAQDKMKLAS